MKRERTDLPVRVIIDMRPVVSIIIPNHNYAQYIGDAIRSVSAQTLKNWECIIIDDASTDDSVAVIRRHIKSDPRFRLIRMKKQSGVSVARNAGLDAARGEYVAFLDADDCYTDAAMETLLHLAKTTGADMAGGRSHNVHTEFKFIPNRKAQVAINNFAATGNPSDFLLLPKQFNWCWIWRRIYRRDFIGKNRFLPQFKTFGDDLCFMLDICHRAKICAECDTVCVYHRIHTNAITTGEFDNYRFEWFPVYFQHINETLLDKYSSAFWRRFFRATFGYLLIETVINPKRLNKCHAAAKAALIKSCAYIPRRYLRLKQRIICWFLLCLK